MSGLDEEVKNQEEETKIVDLDEEKKKRKPFHYWTVGGRDYRLKLKASNIEKLENKYKCNVMHLVDDMPALSVMLTIIQAAMLPWEHGVKYDDILNLSTLFNEKAELCNPWDFYPQTFKEDKENYEHQKLEAELADYRDKRRRWADEFNRRRQQGM